MDELERYRMMETIPFSISLILRTVKTFDNHLRQRLGRRYID